jgi:ribosome biogenesis protein BMS1
LEKHKKIDAKKRGIDEGRQRNAKAFSIQSVAKHQKQVMRSAEFQEKRIHVPLPDRSVDEPAPFIVAVQGPPKVIDVLLTNDTHLTHRCSAANRL